MDAEPLLRVEALNQAYGGSHILRDVALEAREGEITVILGRNGVGKTTLLKSLMGVVPVRSGRVVFDGDEVTRETPYQRARRGIAYVPQGREIFNRLTVRENLTIAVLAELRGKFRLDMWRLTEKIPGLNEAVAHNLALVNLTRRADTPVSALAYGEKRRLEIGLALAASPSLLLLDEPLAGMSPQERVDTVQLLKSISKGRTMIVIDHDKDSLFELVERVTVLQEGRVLVEGTPEEIEANAQVQEAYLGGVAIA